MLVRECMSKQVELAAPTTTLVQATQMMKRGDFGALPVQENDRLVGVVTDRDIAIRGVAERRNPETTELRDIMSMGGVLYCFDDEEAEAAAHKMAANQVRRLPVLNRKKRLVGIVSLGDLSGPQVLGSEESAQTLSQISKHLRQGTSHFQNTL